MAIEHTPRLGIETWSHGTDRHPPRAVWDAQQRTLDDLVAIDRQYATLAERPAAGVRGTYCWVEATGILYRDDGAQWRPIVQFGGGAGAAVVAGGSGSEGSSSRAARADHSHPLPLVTSSAHGAMRREDKTTLDAATTASTANTLVRRNADGRSDFAAVRVLGSVTDANHATRKDYVDAQVGAVHNPTALPAAANLDAYTSSGVFIQRNTAGATNGSNYPIAQAGLLLVHSDGSAWVYQEYRTPGIGSSVTADVVFFRSRYNETWSAWRQAAPVDYVDAGDAAARSYADSAVAAIPDATRLTRGLMPAADKALVDTATANATGSALMRRDGSGRVSVGAPGVAAHATPKDYVDAGLATRLEITKRMPSTNVDQVIEPGQYYITSTSGYTNNPMSAAAILEVFWFSTSGNWIIQRWTSWAAAQTFTRSSNDAGATWKPWREHASTDVATGSSDGLMSSSDKSLVDGATSIAATSGSRLVRRDSSGRYRAQDPADQYDVANRRYVDGAARQDVVLFPKSLGTEHLDDFIAAEHNGVYRQGASASASTDRGYPTGVAGMLEVSQSTNMVWQRYTTYNTGNVYVRSWYQGTWYPWKRLINDTDMATSSADGLMSAADKSLLGTATTNATGNALMRRDSSGRASVAAPTSAAHVARKDYVDSGDAAAQSNAEATAASALSPVKALTDAATPNATGNALVRRDSAGRFKAATPSATTDVAIKSYVDGQASSAQSAAEGTAAAALAPVKTTVDNATASATANRLVLRDSAGRFKAATPSATTDVANKSYVDGRDSALQAAIDALSYASGARQVDYNGGVIGGIQGVVTLSRVGHSVEITLDGMRQGGSTTPIGRHEYTILGTSRALPSGFRPTSGVSIVGVAGMGESYLIIASNGTVSLSTTARDTSGTALFSTPDSPPASFTWGDPVT